MIVKKEHRTLNIELRTSNKNADRVGFDVRCSAFDVRWCSAFNPSKHKPQPPRGRIGYISHLVEIPPLDMAV